MRRVRFSPFFRFQQLMTDGLTATGTIQYSILFVIYSP